jgi:hypothetical protein
MQAFPTVYPCSTKKDLMKQVTDVHKVLMEFYKSIPDDVFNSKGLPDGWSPKGNALHVIGSNNGFGLWLTIPSSVLKYFFKPRKIPHTIEELKATNRFGISNYGRYKESKPLSPEKREKIIQAILDSADKLNRRIDKHTDSDLDNLLGLYDGMSLKTLVYFLLKHNIHHTNVVRLRLEESKKNT